MEGHIPQKIEEYLGRNVKKKMAILLFCLFALACFARGMQHLEGGQEFLGGVFLFTAYFLYTSAESYRDSLEGNDLEEYLTEYAPGYALERSEFPSAPKFPIH